MVTGENQNYRKCTKGHAGKVGFKEEYEGGEKRGIP